MKIRVFTILFFSMLELISNAQYDTSITVSTTMYTPQQLVEDVLVNGCVHVSNVTYTGAAGAIGYFDATGSSFDTIMHNGIIMASGLATNAVGPNNNAAISTSFNLPGDPDLTALIPGYQTYDACVLEFDFVPSSDTLKFRYVFGSDEYLEYVGTSFNDVFGFFLTGPNPSGGNYTTQNIAIIPSTTTPVSINNVNNVNNSSYYINNGTGSTPNNEALQYDGYTVGLTAFALVTPCATYYIKLAVADAGDHVLDSGVFLEAGSFTDGTSVSLANINSIGTQNNVYEGCTNYYVFSRADTTNLTFPVTFPLTYGGTATMGVDISFFPDSITIPIGQVSDTVYYTVYEDSIVEPPLTFIISIAAGCPCNPTPSSDTLIIHKYIQFKAGITNTDSMFCGINVPPTYTMHAVCISHPAWFVTFLWSTGATTANITVVPPPPGQADVYWCIIADLCGVSITDSITVGVSHLAGISLAKTNALCYNACNGTATIAPIPANTPGVWYEWSNPAWPNTINGHKTGICAGTYSVSVTDSSYCYFDTTFTITQPSAALDPSSGIASTVTDFCSSPGNITLTAVANIPNVTYSWNGAANSGSTLVVNPPTGTTNYWVKISDYCGYNVYDTVTIHVSDMSVATVLSNDASCYGICNGLINVFIPYGIPPYSYAWSSPSTGTFASSSGVVDSLCPDNYTVTITDAIGCTYSDGFTILQPDQFSLASGITNTDTMYCGVTPPASLQLQTTVNIPDVNYHWNTGSTNPYINITPVPGATKYWVSISDNCGHSVNDTVTIVVSSMNGVSAVTDTTHCYNSCDGYVQITPTGGSTPYTFLWNPSSVGTSGSGTISNICQGSYGVTVKDNVGCQFSTSFTIDGPGPLSESFISNTNTFYCGVAPPSSLTLQTWINTSPVTFAWFNGDTSPTTVVHPTVGPNYYSVTFTDECNNTYTDTLLVSVSSLSGINVITDSTLCFGSCDGHAHVTLVGGMSPFTYSWAPDTLGLPNVNTVSTLCAGTYTVTATDYSGCHVQKNFIIASPTRLTTTFTISNIPHPGVTGAAAATVHGGTPPYSYFWDDPASHHTYNCPGLEVGIYHITITDVNGCTLIDSVSILGIEGPDIYGQLHVYPNPSSNGNFSIDFGRISFQSAEISVYDVTGKMIREEIINGSSHKNYMLFNLPQGISMLTIRFDGDKLITRSLVVE
ncbi:MAG: choice-of-anchor L domain-containing protein [Bacteroidia bacterium]|nr:choice-of-anchor L domain-containing protein [Bacteroidia bacterium]